MCDFEAKRPKILVKGFQSRLMQLQGRGTWIQFLYVYWCSDLCSALSHSCGWASIASLFFLRNTIQIQMLRYADCLSVGQWSRRGPARLQYIFLITRQTQTCFIAAKRKCICFNTMSFMPCHMQNQSTYTNKILHRS
jgi:hypothetical protein